MKNRMLMFGLIALALTASLGCSAASPTGANANGAVAQTTVTGIPVSKLCRMTEDPVFVKRDLRSDSCDAEFYFAPKNTAAYGDTHTPGFYFLSQGQDGMVYHVLLSMSGTTDTQKLQFFATEAGAISRLIDGRPLPEEIEKVVGLPPSLASDAKVTTENAEFKFETSSDGGRELVIDVLQK